MKDKTRKITHTYNIVYHEEAVYDEIIEAENEEEAENIFLERLSNGDYESCETNGLELEISEQE